MKFAVIAAVEAEYEALKKSISVNTVKNVSGLDFLIGKLGSIDVVCCMCGAGKVNSAVAAEAIILLFSPDAVINSGICGGISKKLKPGDIVIPDDCVQHDMDTSEAGDPRGEVSRLQITYFPCDKVLSKRLTDAAKRVISRYGVFSGRIATGDVFLSSDEKTAEIGSYFKADAVDMETCAIAHACYMNGIPFAAVRSVSDDGSDGAFANYLEFMHIAAENSVKIIKEFAANMGSITL